MRVEKINQPSREFLYVKGSIVTCKLQDRMTSQTNLYSNDIELFNENIKT